MEMHEPDEVTLEHFCRYIAPDVWDRDKLLVWPPDAFAVAASILLKTGAYCYAVDGWRREVKLTKWIEFIRELGRRGRNNPQRPPRIVRTWHQVFISEKNRKIKLSEIDLSKLGHRSMCEALLKICAAADEACEGIGLDIPLRKKSTFLGEASERLFLSKALGVSTLCKHVRPSIVRVLPKLHTPQSGITIRSLSHHLALCPAGDVKAVWGMIRSKPSIQHCINLLLAPWPKEVNPRDFAVVKGKRSRLPDMPNKFGFFEFDPKQVVGEPAPRLALSRLLKQAHRVVEHIDGVVFPELALTRKQYKDISAYLMRRDIFLICGVREQDRNYLLFDVPFPVPGNDGRKVVYKSISHQQSKHHRWRLDKRQIVQYGLGSCLNVGLNWWEHIQIDQRKLNFVALNDWLVVCALICEDLARQDPVAEVVRAVGPNLVIALLMDGPQLASRWPARYATVLADDPGSSVLTLTSIGMCELSRPPSQQKPSRAVAMWKDANTGEAVTIELPEHSDGVVLSISCLKKNEWAADGRDDQSSTSYPTLSGIHYVSSEP